ncbi:hypothetical protein [Alcanivorax sp.]|uniref:hypothetical protein n=1 Tax=Alcanivorax sp. TaxID=1872427 RepID=UPI0025BF4833|nr:hypothetical protein [Alcanivorax sp.]
MDQDWILQKKETRRAFSKSTWVPLRAAVDNEHGNVKNLGYSNEFFGCGSVAFSPENREIADKLSWGDIGLSKTIGPYAYEDGCSGLMNPDTNVGGKVTTLIEVSDDQKTTFLYS